MTVKVGVSSNIDSVIKSVDDVQDDVQSEFRRKVSNAVRVMWKDALGYIASDPHVSGELMQNTEFTESIDSTSMEFAVEVNRRRSEYAAVVEFGSGLKTNKPFEGSEPIPPDMYDSVPSDFPYESPDIPYNTDDPSDTQGYEKFYGFTKYIEEWMRTKPLTPKSGNYFVSAAYIAAEIIEKGNYAHPFLRPAYFDNELLIKEAAENARRSVAR
jgi:hypothetical protein